MNARAAVLLFVAVLGFVLGACVDPVPIAGAPCPCPTGYCCAPNLGVCIAGDSCAVGAAGTGANPDAGGPAEVGAPSGRHLSYGNEIVVGITASGRWLVSLEGAEVSLRAGVRGQLVVRDLEAGGDAQRSGEIVQAQDVSLGSVVDALLVPNVMTWTPAFGFNSLAPDAGGTLAPDGRSYLAYSRVGSEHLNSVDLVSTQSVIGSVNRWARLQQVVPTQWSAGGASAFSPAGDFAYLLEQHDDSDDVPLPARLSRLPLDRSASVVSYEANYIWSLDNYALGAFAFGGDGSILFKAPGGIWVWREGEDAPVELVHEGPWAAEIVGAHGDFVYYLREDLDMNTFAFIDPQVFRVSISTGQRRKLLDGAFFFFVPSPDGRVAVAGPYNTEGPQVLIDLETGETIAKATERNLSPADRFKLAFTPDSRWLYGALERNGLWLGDVVAMDTHTGQVRTLAPQATPHTPLLADDDRVVFVRMSSGKDDFDRNAQPGGPPLAAGDLVVVSLETGNQTVLAQGVDEYIGVRGKTVVFSRHASDATQGVYAIDLP